MTRLTMGSLFAGIGGFDLGFERAGFETRWQVEWDRHASAVLARHWPDVARYGDIRDVSGHELEPVDVITFGSPCQDLSVAGKRTGLAGEQSSMFFEALRVFREMMEATDGRSPALVVWENVPGAFSSNSGRDFAHVLAGLAELGAVDIAWRVLDAQYFGVAQRRRRVFVVADFGGERAAEVLFEPESVRGNPPARRAAGQGVAVTIGSRSARSHTERNGHGAYVVQSVSLRGREGGAQVESGGDVSPALRSGDGGASRGGFVFAFSENGHGDVSTGDIMPALTTGGGKPGQSYPAVCVAPTVSTKCAKGSGGSADDDAKNFVPIHIPDTIGTLTPGAHPGGLNGQEAETQSIAISGGVRRLTPRECERLQGFPDDWTSGQRDSHRYRQLGNAVAVPVAEWIGRRIVEVLGGE